MTTVEEAIAAALSSRDEALSAAKAEVERLKKLAKELSDALLKVRPLGGSELFRRFDDKTFYADPEYCGRAIEQLRDRQHEACKEAVREHKRAEAAEAREAEARKVTPPCGLYDVDDNGCVAFFETQEQRDAFMRFVGSLPTPSPSPSKDGAGLTDDEKKARAQALADARAREKAAR